MNNKELITKLLNLFSSQEFADWLRGRFDRYISGDMIFEDGLPEEECVKIIRKDVAEFLNVEDKE